MYKKREKTGSKPDFRFQITTLLLTFRSIHLLGKTAIKRPEQKSLRALHSTFSTETCFASFLIGAKLFQLIAVIVQQFKPKTILQKIWDP